MAAERVICGMCHSEECVKDDQWPWNCPVMQPLPADESRFPTLLKKLLVYGS